MVDPTLLDQALGELVRLRAMTDRRARFRAGSYVSALQEWAARLCVDPLKLNKLVLIKEAISRHHRR
jgi:hypothetical protein